MAGSRGPVKEGIYKTGMSFPNWIDDDDDDDDDDDLCLSHSGMLCRPANGFSSGNIRQLNASIYKF